MTKGPEMIALGQAHQAASQGANAGLVARRAERALGRYRILMRKAGDGYTVAAQALHNHGYHTDLTTEALMAYAGELLVAGRLDVDAQGSLELPPRAAL